MLVLSQWMTGDLAFADEARKAALGDTVDRALPLTAGGG
jgi:hypothetical protein